MEKQIKNRDFNIVLCAKGLINLGTKTVKDKTKYNRKEKHKNNYRKDI